MDIYQVARKIADSIIETARLSGDDPIAWITGNSYAPPLRSFPEAETIWQSAENDDGELFEALSDAIDRILDNEHVYMTSPEYDNALYAVDLTRFTHADGDDHETLQDDWIMYNSGMTDNT